MVFLAIVVSAGLPGCLGDSGEAGQSDPAALPKCPDGEEMRTGTFDIGTNPQVAPSKRKAIAKFLQQERSDLKAASFDRRSMPGGRRRASFGFERDSAELVRLYLERLDGGWLVMAYAYCEGEL